MLTEYLTEKCLAVLFHVLKSLLNFLFSAIKSCLWAKQKSSKKHKNETSKEEKTAKPEGPAAAVSAVVPQLTEAERMRQTPFERLVYDMSHNERIVNDLMLGRRVGFYELRGEIGQGNFSTVRLGIHALTKGKALLLFHCKL